jgi:hypothetical protein
MNMADTRDSKSQTLDLGKEVEAEVNDRDEVRREGEQAEQQDLNQGMDTGTHGSERHGVNWGPSYRVKHTSTRSKGAKQRNKKR